MPPVENLLFDKREQVDKIVNEGHLLEDELLFAVLDMKGGGTGFLGLTDRRMLFYDKSFIGKHKAIVTVPYNKITAIGSEDQGRILRTSKLIVKVGSESYEFEFWSQDKGHAAYHILVRELLQNEPR